MSPLLALLLAAAVLAQPTAAQNAADDQLQPDANVADLLQAPDGGLQPLSIQPKSNTDGKTPPVALVRQGAIGPFATTFDLVAGTPLTLDGSQSNWTSGYQVKRATQKTLHCRAPHHC